MPRFLLVIGETEYLFVVSKTNVINMKKIIYNLVFLLITISTYCQIGVGTNSPNSSSVLDIASSTQGVLIPRMTSLERDAIINPIEGLFIYNIETDCFNQFTNAKRWQAICGTEVIYTVEGCSGTVWLDRNLGALRVATLLWDPQAQGDLYQWGRGTDGHQLQTSDVTTVLSATDNPGHDDFIITSGNWRSPANNSLWQGVNGANNPCPTGFRVPTSAELDCERRSWLTNNATGAFASSLKWTTSGYRYPTGIGPVYSPEGYVRSWSSTNYSTTKAYFLHAYTSTGMYYDIKSMGMGIRCIKD